MSHFTVMIFGEDYEKQLAPYEEETRDQTLLSFVDNEDEYRQKYENEGIERVVMPDGRLLLTWDDEFKKPGSLGISTGTHEVPEDLEKRQVPFKETYATFEEFVEGWHGDEKRDPVKGRYGYWENPNAKWDWYIMGGRWSGYFRLKRQLLLPPTAGTILGESGLTGGEIMVLVNLRRDSPDKYKTVLTKYRGKEDQISKLVQLLSDVPSSAFQPGARGRPGLMDSSRHEGEGYADSVKKGDIDVDYMRLEAEAEALQRYRETAAFFPGGIIPKIKTWSEFLAEHKKGLCSIDAAREAYHAQAAVSLFRSSKPFEDLGDFQITEEEYTKTARDSAISTFAVIKDGRWYERGVMGWWGMVSDEKDKTRWNEEFTKLFDAVPDDELVTVVDCHI